MLFPKKVAHRKWQTGRKNPLHMGNATRGTRIQNGTHGLKAITSARITAQQIESARKVLTRETGKYGKYWIRIFPDRPITRKAAEVGMGKGKGDPQGFCVEVLPGRILFEVGGVTEVIAKEALRKAGTKLPVKVRVINAEDIY